MMSIDEDDVGLTPGEASVWLLWMILMLLISTVDNLRHLNGL